METATVCTGLLAVLLFGLGLGVSMMRGRTNTVVGYSSDPADPLHKWVRAHGNTAEYAPMFAAIFLVAGLRGPGAWTTALMWAATASRWSIVAGMLLSPSLAKPHPLRFAGALGTYVTGVALAIVLLLG